MTGLESSPIFDGSETSLSGNGEYIANQSDIVLGASIGLSPIYLPAGTGGGCVKSGPFANMSVNLGPAALDVPGGTAIVNNAGALSYNPRCLKRDLVGAILDPYPAGYCFACLFQVPFYTRLISMLSQTDYVNQKYANATAVLSNIVEHDNIYGFEYRMQGVPNSGSIGIHGGGHYSIGGDPGRGKMVSPTYAAAPGLVI